MPATAGSAYEFSNVSKSDATSYVTVQFRKSDGTYSYLDLGVKPPSPSWSEFKSTFTVPVGAVAMTVFHLIKSNGTLDTDDYSIKKINYDPNKFDRGYVSMNFDDGHLSVYEKALPILDAAGFKSDQFITTDYLSANYPGYVKPHHVVDMQSRGHVIGAHTRSHANLAQLSVESAREEIIGSKNDLIDIGIDNVTTFAYPFGAYNSTVKQIVKDGGFITGRSSDGGFNDKRQDIFALRRMSMENTTTISDVKAAIDRANTEKTWLVLLFHEVDTNGHRYSVTPDFLSDIVSYLKQKDMRPITLKEGVNLINQ